MGTLIELAGKKFGRLTVVRRSARPLKNGSYWDCLCECGNTKTVRSMNLRNGNTKSCGCLQNETVRGKGAANANWKGGRRKHGEGYIRIHSPTHPCADQDGYVFEHRIVMEKILGRFLKPKEVVHHKDGNVANNARDNLRLFANGSEHDKYHWGEGNRGHNEHR